MGTIVIFGATGDLAGRKLIPAIYNLWVAGYLPERIAVVGVARREKSEAEFREEMCEALKEHSRTGHGSSDTCDPFVSNLYYHRCDVSAQEDFSALSDRLGAIEQEAGFPGNRLFYLALGPELFGPIVDKLGAAGLIRAPRSDEWSRVVVEKPFGLDLDSAVVLNQRLRRVVAEEQIFRIDHYLGKETVQNIFAFRFGNAIFEPLFNHRYVDHIQITMAETVGMEGRRGGFYERVGAIRDVVQNHLLQVVCLIAMEPPAVFDAKEIRDEKLKVLRSITLPLDEPLDSWCVRGQYSGGPGMAGYRNEEGVAPDSITETYVALRLSIDNWRWAGVPVLLRTGKRLKERITEVAIQFKHPPTHYFRDLGMDVPRANVLVFRIQPDEAILLTFGAKPPGMDFKVAPATMDFTYGNAFKEGLPEAYERLLLDALRGDSTLFMRGDEVESAWQIVSQVLNRWQDADPPFFYRAGSWGPPEADRVLATCQGGWRQAAQSKA
jgi:glucose-6-phosphate 1-dehydrogenase